MESIMHNFRLRLMTVTALLAGTVIAGGILAGADRPGKSAVMLNEVCCYNDTIVYDKLGEYNDYVELYNPSSENVDISGYSLSDKKSRLKRYTFPEGSFIEGGGYMVLWGGEGSFDSWAEDDSASYLQFSLKPGETVYLSNEEGEVVDKVGIPRDIGRDVSYSRLSYSSSSSSRLSYSNSRLAGLSGLNSGSALQGAAVFGDKWILAEATPGKRNARGMQEAEPLLDTVVTFSVASGFYDTPFWLEMSAEGDCDIYYTLDGSEPGEDSFRYAGPIWIEDISSLPNKYACIDDISLVEGVYIPEQPVEKANIIRAVAVGRKGGRGHDSSAVYFINYGEKYGFDDTAVISLVTDPDNLFGFEDGIYTTGAVWEMNRGRTTEFRQEEAEWMFHVPVNYSGRGKGWQREAAMKYFDKEKNLVYEQQIGLRIRGGVWSSACNQKSFNMIALPETDGNRYVCEGLFGRKEASLMLRTGASRDMYVTNIRDVLNQALITDRNVGIQEYEPCQVFLDGEYWGVYNLQERMDTSYFASHYGVEEDNVIVYKNGWIRIGDEGEQDLYLDMVDFAVNNDLSQTENYEQIELMMDIQSYIDYCCFEVYIANCDSIGNNYGLWRVRKTGSGPYEDGKWRWFIFDTDDSAGMIAGRTDADTDSFMEGNWQKNILDDELFIALIQNGSFKEQFVTTFMDMANKNFNTERVLALIDEMTDKYCDAAVMSHRRFQDANADEAGYYEAVSVLKDFYRKRYDYITAYMKRDFCLQGELLDVQIEHARTDGGVVGLNTLLMDGREDFTGRYYSDYDIYLYAKTDEGYHFAGWEVNGDFISGSELVLQLVRDYHIKPVWIEEVY